MSDHYRRPSPVTGEEIDPLDEVRYYGIPTLLRAPIADTLEGLDVALVGVPFDAGATNHEYRREASVHALLHNSRAGLSAYYRYRQGHYAPGTYSGSTYSGTYSADRVSRSGLRRGQQLDQRR